MIQNKKDLDFYILQDRLANLGVEKLGIAKTIAFYIYQPDSFIAYRFLKSLRQYEYLTNTTERVFCHRILRLFAKYQLRRMSIKSNIMIIPNTVGYGLRIAHVVGGGTIINCKSMGNNCTVNVGVLVGVKNTKEQLPIIGDNVEICTGAKVIGLLKIGNNSIVAPNSVVINDVPENTIVSGVPAKILKTK